MNVVNAANGSPSERGLVWVLVGQGEEPAALQRPTEDRAPHLKLLSLQPAETLPQMHAGARVLLLNQISAMENAVIPCKLPTDMAARSSCCCCCRQREQRGCSCDPPGELPDENPEGLSAAVRASIRRGAE